MYYDALTAAAVADELAAALVGGFVQRLVLPSPLSVALEVYAHRRRHHLLLTAEPEHPRVAFVTERPTAQPGLVTPFGLLLRKYVLDGVVEAVEQPTTERLIALSIAHRVEGLNSPLWLQAEVMGRHSNLLLLDGERTTVIESAKRVTPRMSSVRAILPKRPYTPPPPREGLQPHRALPADLRLLAVDAKPGDPLWRVLVGGVAGLSPLAAREIVHRAGGGSATRVRDWEDWTRLAAELRRLASLWATRAWEPTVAPDEGGALAYAPYSLTHLADGEPESVPSISAAIERYAAPAQRAVTGHGQLRGELLRALERRAGQVRARLESLRREREAAGDPERPMEDGRQVLAYAYALSPGQTRLELPDRAIELDPALTPPENAERLFGEYRRRQRAAAGSPERIAEAEAELRNIEEHVTFARLAEGHAELTTLRAEIADSGLIREAEGQRTRKPPVPKLDARDAPDGTRLLVGRSAQQNARVLEAGAPGDWWFHARDVPGGHVVARTGGREPSEETLRTAAELAAAVSAARASPAVEVVYTQMKNVRKIRGAGPGQVTYRNERSVRVSPREQPAP